MVRGDLGCTQNDARLLAYSKLADLLGSFSDVAQDFLVSLECATKSLESKGESDSMQSESGQSSQVTKSVQATTTRIPETHEGKRTKQGTRSCTASISSPQFNQIGREQRLENLSFSSQQLPLASFFDQTYQSVDQSSTVQVLP